MEIISFPSLSERGPLGSGASLLKRGSEGGEEEWRGGGQGPDLTLFLGHFNPLFLSPPVLVQEKLNARILLQSNLWSFPLSERVLQENTISY